MDYNPPLVDTRVREGWLTPEECDFIIQRKKEINSKLNITPGETVTSEGLENTIDIIPTNPDDMKYDQDILDIILPKFKSEFGEDCEIHGMHILHSYIPYRTHTDGVFGEYGIDDDHFGAWTIVIPLEDANSHTIIWNEWRVEDKRVDLYIANKEPVDWVTDEFHQKYLQHEARENMRYFTLDLLFPWKKGSLMAAARYKFHGSDSFKHSGLESKKAIIIWTAMKYEHCKPEWQNHA